MSDMDRKHVTDSLDKAISAAPTGSSLNDMLHKDGSFTYDNTTDSLEALRDAIDDGEAATTANGTIVQDSAMDTGTPDIVNLNSSASANTFGAWTELDASASADIWISHVTVSKSTLTDCNTVVEIGTGAGAAEVAKIRFSLRFDIAGGAGQGGSVIFALPIPIKVASGTRIAAQIADDVANADTYFIGISYYLGL